MAGGILGSIVSDVGGLISGGGKNLGQTGNALANAVPLTTSSGSFGKTVPLAQLQANGAAAAKAAAPVQQTQTANQGATSGGTSSDTDPNYAGQMQGVQGQISNLNSLYNQLFGQFNQGVATQRQGIDSNYQNQQSQLDAQYGQAAPQLQRMEAARGLSDSSYNADSQANAGNIYSTQSQGITTGDQNADRQLAAQAASQLGQYQGQLQGINQIGAQLKDIPNNSSGQYELGSLNGQLAQDLGPLMGALGSAQSPTALSSLLGNIAPSQVYNQSSLQALLSGLGQSTIPGYAQGQIGNAAQANVPGAAALAPQQQQFV